MRQRERDEEPAKGIELDRRKAEDTMAAAERAVFKARQARDDVQRTLRAGKGSADDVNAATTKLKAARDKLSADREALAKVSALPDMPLPSRLESGLTISRTDLSQVETAIERTRIRAPSDGTVLNVWAKAGELAETLPDTAPRAVWRYLEPARTCRSRGTRCRQAARWSAHCRSGGCLSRSRL